MWGNLGGGGGEGLVFEMRTYVVLLTFEVD